MLIKTRRPSNKNGLRITDAETSGRQDVGVVSNADSRARRTDGQADTQQTADTRRAIGGKREGGGTAVALADSTNEWPIAAE